MGCGRGNWKEIREGSYAGRPADAWKHARWELMVRKRPSRVSRRP